MSRRATLLALLPLALILGVATVLVPWHSLISCDCRTYLEMIRGVLQHGLPYTVNGPAGQFPELVARWNSPTADDRLWGMYGPVYAYVAAPAFWLDGTRGVLRENIVLVAVIAAGTYRLTRLLVDDARLAIVAAYAVVLGTPVWGLAHAVSAYTLLPALCVWSGYFLCSATSNGRAALGGVLLGLAIATHVMVGPFALVVPLAFLAYDRRQLPAVVVGLFVGLLPAISVNLLRYGSVNPLAAAPCIWQSCRGTGVAQQNLGAIVKFAGPTLLVAAMGLALQVGLRKRALAARAGALVFSLAVLLVPSGLRVPTVAMARLAAAVLFDIGLLAIPTNDFQRPPDGRGYLMLDFAVKSVLQCSPLVALAFGARARRPEDRLPLALLASQCAAILGVIALRAEISPAYAIGFPILHLRYTFAVLPFAVVLALVAVDRTRPPLWLFPASLLVGLGLSVVLWPDTDDRAPWRRLLELRATLAAGALALVAYVGLRLVKAPPRWLPILYAPALVLSVAVTIGVDLRGWIHLRNQYEKTFRAVDRALPRRAALIAHAVVLDPALGTLADHDLEYADLYESRDRESLHRLILHWLATERPVYIVTGGGTRVESPYPDLRYVPVEKHLGIARVTTLDEPP